MTSGQGLGQGRTGAGATLLEREAEIGLFEQLLSGAGDDARLVIIEGPAGIGKSRLIAELRVLAATEGVRVLMSAGSDLERDFPFGVVRQLFEPVLFDAQVRTRLFDGAAGSARSVFELLDGTAAIEGDASFAALHGLYWLTVNLAADGPMMLVVDDLHWCDRPSLRFLAYLSRRLEGLGGLLVAGLRSAEPGTDPVLLGEIASIPESLRVHPGPLSDDAVAEMVRVRLGAEPDPAFVVACRAATGGNPLLLRQLLSSLASDGVVPRARDVASVERVGPRAVARTVLVRLRRLSEPASTVAQAIAVLGTHAELPLVAALSGIDEVAVARATAALAQAEILRPDPPLGFVHPLVRDAVYHQLPPGERELLHAAAARLLIEARVAPEAVATHLLAAPHRGQPHVVELLREASRAALRKGAAESAVAYLGRALEEPPSEEEIPGILLELGLAETLISGVAAAAHLREAWPAVGDPAERARVAATLARTLLFTAPGPEAIEVAQAALGQTPEQLVDERQALRALELMAVFFGAGNEEAIWHLEGVEIVGDGPGAKMLAAIVAFCRALTGASAAQTVPMALAALADGVLIAADPGLFPVAAITVLMFADRDEAMSAWDELRERAHRGGSLLGILTVGLWRGVTLIARGDLREAEESLATAQEDFVSWGLVRSGETYGPAFLGAARLYRGDLAGARRLLDPSKTADNRVDADRHLRRFWCELLLAEGRHEQALAVADDLAERMVFIEHPAWAPWRSLKARALEGLGRNEEAIELVRVDVEHARRFGAPGNIGRAMCLLGRLERERGLDRLREAVAVLETSAAKLDLAIALFELGSALRRDRRPSDAREPLRRALELADRCGADGLVAQARTELYATGARPRSSALEGVGALTASERRVADLAVEGRSNKEIAQSLYVTPKTVEVHLSNTYRKLNIRSRQELIVALAD